MYGNVTVVYSVIATFRNTLTSASRKSEKSNLFGTVVLLSELVSVHVVLGLGHGVSTGGGLVPGIIGVSSTRLVERGVVKELEGLLDVLVVVGAGLGSILGTDLTVLVGGESVGNVRLFSDGSLLDLLNSEIIKDSGRGC